MVSLEAILSRHLRLDFSRWADETMLTFGAWSVAALPAGPRGNLSPPVRVHGPQPFTVHALWTQGPRYVSEAQASLECHAHLLTSGPVVVAGDPNSNSR